MRDARDIIVKPIISEKSYDLVEKNKYVFEVHPDANKIEIGRAVAEIFGVEVEDVNTINVKGKPRKVRYAMGKTKKRKKAVVTLKEGHKIEFFESK